MAFARRFIFLGLIALFGSAASCAPGKPGGAAIETLTIETATGARKFQVEIADTDEERRIGLMHRTQMAENAGMLFDFRHDVSEHSMWMKNTLIPLDMAFIAADGRIARIAADTTPMSLVSISSGEPVAAVLEVNAGRFAALGVKEGDYVRHSFFRDQ